MRWDACGVRCRPFAQEDYLFRSGAQLSELGGRPCRFAHPLSPVRTPLQTDKSESAGLYYPCDSLKTRLCVLGRQRLYAYARRKGIPYRKLGKLVVATSPGGTSYLDRLKGHVDSLAGLGLQVPVERIDGERAREMEPDLGPGVICSLSRHFMSLRVIWKTWRKW